MSHPEKGICPVCNQERKCDKGGRMEAHHRFGHFGEWCEGVQQPAKQITKWSADPNDQAEVFAEISIANHVSI